MITLALFLAVVGNAQEAAEGQTTSQGQLASALSTINGNLVQLANQANQYAQTESQQLNQALSLTTTTSAILINSEISSLQLDLDDTLQTIEDLQARINESTQICSSYSLCSQCTANQACVWCSAMTQCVAGDSNGPLNGECSDYAYNSCGGGCAELMQCTACVANENCGWCSNGGACLESAEGCNADFWVTASGSCPAAQTPSYESFRATPLVDTQLSRLQRDLNSNTRKADQLRDQIETLQKQLDEANKQVQTDVPQVEPLHLENGLEGVGDVVDATATNESEG